jgi:hypothetical protein
VISAGPTKAQALAHIVAGAFDTPKVTLELKCPHRGAVHAVYAAAHIASGNPPSPETKYQIEYSLDEGRTWNIVVKDWRIARAGEEPNDFWSQSFCYGSAVIAAKDVHSVQVRFRNDGGKRYLRAEAHLVYWTSRNDSTRAAFAWKEDGVEKRASHVFGRADGSPWHIETGKNIDTDWVEMAIANGE